MYENYDWKDLVTRARAGEQKAMEEIILAFDPLIDSLRNARKYRPLGEDVIGICYLEVCELVHGYNGNDFDHFPGYVKSYLLGKLGRELEEYYKFHGAVVKSTEDEDYLETEGHEFESTSVNGILLRDLLAGLSERQRQVIELHYFKDMSMGKIATRLGIARQMVGKIHAAALRRMRSML